MASKGCVVRSFVLSSPIGDLGLSCCAKAIHSLNMLRNPSSEAFQPDNSISITIKGGLDEEKLDNCHEVALGCVSWLQKYFHDTRRHVGLTQIPPICPLQGSIDGSFRTRVWNTLAHEVKFGATVSYAELASLSGSSAKASRAVGQAMRTNPVILLIPCHRVILSDGKIGNFGSGKMNDVKAWLLQHEKHED